MADIHPDPLAGNVPAACSVHMEPFPTRSFRLKMDAAKCRQVKDILEKIIDKETDSLRFYYLGEKYKNKVEHVGAKAGFDVMDTLIL